MASHAMPTGGPRCQEEEAHLELREVFMLDAHDGPIVSPGRHLQAVWARVLVDDQAMIAGS